MCRYRFITRIISIFGLMAVVACSVKKTDIGSGGPEPVEPGGTPGGVISIAALKEMYVDRPATINEEVSIRGKVVSSDQYGNFYKTVCVQDDSGGIAIMVDMEMYFRTFNIYGEVTVYCNSLTLGTYGGEIRLGVLSADGTNTVTYISGDYILSAIRAGEDFTEVVPEVVPISGLSPRHINTYVRIDDVQFEEAGGGVAWCREGEDTNRTLVDIEGNRLDVRTSRYARFADRVLPEGSGYICGVLGYFNGSFQLRVKSESDVAMRSERF